MMMILMTICTIVNTRSWRGPCDVFLPQRMYDLIGEAESFPHLFIVPVGRTSDAYEYEAVFT